MRAAIMYGPGDVRVETVADPVLRAPGDALVRVLRACICGSDLWPYASMGADEAPQHMGHEFLGVVEDVGADVARLRRGDLVVAPFTYSDGSCDFCREGLTTSCRNGGFYGRDTGGGQGEAVRVPHADGTLVPLAVEQDSALLPGLLTLSDVMCTGHHAAVRGGVQPGSTVTVIGDGAVGLCAVIASARLGAKDIVLMGRHTDRTDLGRDFGATDVVAERGEQGVERVRDLTGGEGTHAVLDCVGTLDALSTAFAVARPGGTVSRVGVPQYGRGPIGGRPFRHNITLTGGIAPARAYIDELLSDVLSGRIQPGRVFDRTVDLDGVPDGYRAMAAREALKVLVAF